MALRFETKKPGVHWTAVALDIVGAATGGGMRSSYSGKAKVVAFNDSGKHHVLEAVDSEQMAEDLRDAIERDYELLSAQAWSDRGQPRAYGSPVQQRECGLFNVCGLQQVAIRQRYLESKCQEPVKSRAAESATNGGADAHSVPVGIRKNRERWSPGRINQRSTD